MHERTLPVAVFDSGLGGISILRELVRVLPGEDYLYLGDSVHAPYGVKSAEEVLRLSRENTELLLSYGAKALVIACNTATSAAAQTLRRIYPSLPIIGTEPALKPAVERHPGGRILVLATPMTVAEEKFQRLWSQYRGCAEITPVACGGLMEFVERGELEGAAVEAYLREKLAPYLDEPVDAVVLGCTHYPFLRHTIRAVIGTRAEILDGSHGIAVQLRRRLREEHLLNTAQAQGMVRFMNSANDPALLARSEAMLRLPEEQL